MKRKEEKERRGKIEEKRRGYDERSEGERQEERRRDRREDDERLAQWNTTIQLFTCGFEFPSKGSE